MEDSRGKNIAVVTGDVTVDWNLALHPSSENGGVGGTCWKDAGARVYQQRGGAALLADLIDRVADNLRKDNLTDWDVRSVNQPCELIFPGDERFHHLHVLWSPFKGKEPAWRVKEFLGLSRRLSNQPGEWQMVKDDSPEAGLVILDDADLGFREQPELWPSSVREKDSSAWILVKMERPVAQGKLWEHLHRNCAQRVIVVMNVNDLRRTEVQISRELSWERTAHDLYWELTHNPRVNALSRCAHVIVSLDTVGAFLLSQSHDSERNDSFLSTLFFDPEIVEGMWNQTLPGEMIGYTSCLTAAIARQLMLNISSPDISSGIQSGLTAMRLLHQKGYTEPDETKGQTGLKFPVGAIADKLAAEDQPLKKAVVPNPVRFLFDSSLKNNQEGSWTILNAHYHDSLEQAARKIVLEGVGKVLDGVPQGKFGKLITVDRREVENFRSIRSLIGEYCGQSLSKPLSIAVFGPPGSGKSFAVKQIAASIRPDEIIPLEFNLSQISSIDGLYDAFHQVRDAALSGKIPLVFWDEFDSTFQNQSLGWLRYFLAPMQDGAFQEGQITHPIGRCIFVFAGGTCSRMDNFTNLLGEEEFVKMKGPDFLSRLKGYVNIFGPNPYKGEEEAADPYYLIRRAIILRVILELNVPQIFTRAGGIMKLNIDPGALRALLHIPEYKHGVRSIESIISMSRLVSKTSFERSSLPPEAQLNLHVNGREFLSLAQLLELEGAVLEKLAEAVHIVYCEGKKRDGWKLGPRNDDNKTHPMLKPYRELDEIDKEANRVNVRSIPTKLSAAGYIMVPARSDEAPLVFPRDDLEKLAELEHSLWVKSKLEQGFTPGRPTTDNPRCSEYLVEWDKLSDEIKEIDRNLVRGIPKILAKAGYAVVKLAKELPN